MPGVYPPDLEAEVSLEVFPSRPDHQGMDVAPARRADKQLVSLKLSGSFHAANGRAIQGEAEALLTPQQAMNLASLLRAEAKAAGG